LTQNGQHAVAAGHFSLLFLRKTHNRSQPVGFLTGSGCYRVLTQGAADKKQRRFPMALTDMRLS
jgi:hypothetical protein